MSDAWIVKDTAAYICASGGNFTPKQSGAQRFASYEDAIIARRVYLRTFPNPFRPRSKDDVRIFRLKVKPRCPTCGRIR